MQLKSQQKIRLYKLRDLKRCGRIAAWRLAPAPGMLAPAAVGSLAEYLRAVTEHSNH